MSNIFEDLKAPFKPCQVKSRTQAGKKLHYIDARNVMDRLDDVVGPDNWENSFQWDGIRTVCTLTIHIDGKAVTKQDGAGDTNIEGKKGGLSDAFKRSAVMFGIGRYLYDGGDPKKVYEAYHGKNAPTPKAITAGSLEECIESCNSNEELEQFRLDNLTALKNHPERDRLLKLYNTKKESF